jgi:hypothetical protein
MFAVARLFSSFNTTKFFSLRLSLRWATPRKEPDDEGRDVTASSNFQMHGGVLENPAI